MSATWRGKVSGWLRSIPGNEPFDCIQLRKTDRTHEYMGMKMEENNYNEERIQMDSILAMMDSFEARHIARKKRHLTELKSRLCALGDGSPVVTLYAFDGLSCIDLIKACDQKGLIGRKSQCLK